MPDQFQYIKLPDGSYGKFRADATDADIKTAITKDFPSAFPGQAAPPPSPKPAHWYSTPLYPKVAHEFGMKTAEDIDVQQHPYVKAAAEFSESLTSPLNLGLTAGTAMLGPAIAGAGKAIGMTPEIAALGGRTVGRLVSAGFSYDMLHHAWQQVPEFRDVMKAAHEAEVHGDMEAHEKYINQAKYIGAQIGLGGVMGLAAGKHALTGGIESSARVPESKSPMPTVEQIQKPVAEKPPVYPPEVKRAIRTLKQFGPQAKARTVVPVEATKPAPLEPTEVVAPPRAEGPVAPPAPPEEIKLGKNGKPVAPRQESEGPRKPYPMGEQRAAAALKDWKAAESERGKLENLVRTGRGNDATQTRIQQLKQRQSVAMRNWGQYAQSVDVEKAVGQYETHASQTLDKLDQLSQHLMNWRTGRVDETAVASLIGRKDAPTPFTDSGTELYGKYIKDWSDTVQGDLDKAELLKRAKGIKETELGQQLKQRLLNLPKQATDALRLGGSVTQVRPSPAVEQAAPVARPEGPIPAKGSAIPPVEESIKYDKDTLPGIKFANKSRAQQLAEQVFGKDNYVLKTFETAGAKRSYRVVPHALPKEIRDAAAILQKSQPVPQEAPKPQPPREEPKPAPVQAPGQEGPKRYAEAKPISGLPKVEQPAATEAPKAAPTAKPVPRAAAPPPSREPIQTTPKSKVGVPLDADLFDQALSLAKQQGQIGVSDLKTKLDISGGAAIKLIDRLEAEGHIGPAEKPSLPRKYIGRETPSSPLMGTAVQPLGEAKGSTADVSKTLGAKPGFMQGPGEANPERGSFIFGNAQVPTGNTNPISRLSATLNQHLNPSATRELTETVVRGRLGTLAREKEMLVSQLSDHISRHDSDGEGELRAFMDAGEGKPGSKFLNAADQALAQQLHQMFQERWDHLKKLVPDRFKGAGIDNYLKHLFKGPNSQNIAQRILFGKRPLEGPATFTRHRFYEFLSDAMDQGAEPVTYNPIRMQLMGLHEIDRYIMAHEIKNDLKARGLIQFFKIGARGKGTIPPGWARIDDRIFQPRALSKGGLTSYGEYWAPADVAKTFNNFLSPGLRGKLAYEVVRNYGNLLNQIQLNFSAFHATFTTVNAAMSDMALGFQKLVKGDLGGLVNVGRSFSVIGSAKRYYSLGRMLEQEYVTPGSRPQFSGLAKAVEIADGRIGVDPFYEDMHIDKFRGAWNNHRYVESAFRAIPAAAEYSSHWLMKYMVPRIKLGIFADMAQWKMGDLIKNGATQDSINSELGKIWDSVDNRAGQLVYDNLFWNKTLKDLGMLSVRSLGWNIGTFRELGGGLVDTGRQIGRVARGERPELTYRMAYTMSLPIIAGFLGATYNYLSTGQTPRQMEDYFFPRTGKLNAQGKAERVSLPSYMRDVWALGHAPATTMVHKLHPFFEQLAEMYENQDFYGTEIRHPDDPWVKQAWDVTKFLGKGFEPLGWQNAKNRAQIEHGDDSLLAPLRPGALGATIASGFGLTPAPAYVGQSKAEELAYEFAKRQYQMGPRTQREFDRFRERATLRNRLAQGNLTGDDISKALTGGKLTMDDVTNIMNEQNMSPLERRFSSLKADEALAVWNEATPNERAQLRPMFLDKFSDLDPNRDADLMVRFQQALQ